jgi:hypothetical protein
MRQSDDMPWWVWLVVILNFIVFFSVYLGSLPFLKGATKATLGFLLVLAMWGIAIISVLIFAIVNHFRKPK